jgi:RHH-type rel operon transcriptional repressor/antitoxin RelB
LASNLKDSQVSVRLPNELKDRMEAYAQITGRTKSYVAMEALSEYLAWRIPQIEDLKEAIAAADQGEFASDEEVDAVFSRYGAVRPVTPARASRPAPTRRRSR